MSTRVPDITGGAPAVSRLVPLLIVIMAVDTTFFAAITPLLPHYASELDLSKSAAGVLSGAYAAGLLACALPGGWVAARMGVRQTLLMSLALLSASSAAFAFGTNIAVLDLARFLQGGSIVLMGGGTHMARRSGAPREARGDDGDGECRCRRRRGTGAPRRWSRVGDRSRSVFSGVSVLAVGLAAWTVVVQAPTLVPRRADLAAAFRSLRRPVMVLGVWLTALPSLFAGVLEVLAPLRLAELGVSGVAIGAVFAVAAAAETIATRLLGGLSDRHGRLAPIRAGLCILEPVHSRWRCPLRSSCWLRS